jgi:hypothetical protein
MESAVMVQGLGGPLPRYIRRFCGVLGNRRVYSRLPIFGVVYVKCGEHGGKIEYTCACFDMSARGIGIEVAGPITVGSVVTVYAGDRGPRRLARVRYCVRETDTYRAGLELTGQAVDKTEK